MCWNLDYRAVIAAEGHPGQLIKKVSLTVFQSAVFYALIYSSSRTVVGQEGPNVLCKQLPLYLDCIAKHQVWQRKTGQVNPLSLPPYLLRGEQLETVKLAQEYQCDPLIILAFSCLSMTSSGPVKYRIEEKMHNPVSKIFWSISKRLTQAISYSRAFSLCFHVTAECRYDSCWLKRQLERCKEIAFRQE